MSSGSTSAGAISVHTTSRGFSASRCAQLIVAVPTTYNHLREEELAEWGIKVVIYANHMLRAAYPAMVKVAESILEIHHRTTILIAKIRFFFEMSIID